MMRSIFSEIADAGGCKLGAVLHAGAGAGREVPEYLRMNADKILLVECHPDLLPQLRKKGHTARQVAVLGSAIAPAAGEPEFCVLNNPGDSSLLGPTQLLQQFPNLKVVGKVPVKAITLLAAISQLAPDPASENLLVLELQGAELSALATTPPEALQKFTWIAVRTSPERLYESGACLPEVDAELRKAGFDPVTPLNERSPLPFRNVLYHRAALRMQVQALTAQLKERDKTLQERTRSFGEQLKERDRSLGEQQKDLAEARKALDKHAKTAEDLAQARQKSEQLATELKRLSQAEVVLKKELDQARQAAALSVRLQTLREADLEDLRGRYKESLSIQERQHQLLVKLGERLSLASSYFHQLGGSRNDPTLPRAGEGSGAGRPRSKKRPGGAGGGA